MNTPEPSNVVHSDRWGACVPFGDRAVERELTTRIIIFGVLLAWCGTLVIFRMHQAASMNYAFMQWNLFLAAIPAVAGWMFARASEKNLPVVVQVFSFSLWLVFLPNAPYVVTDLIHLSRSNAVPLWYDLIMLFSCAATGVLLGYSSLADVQRAMSRRYSPNIGWLVVTSGMLLSGFGIYLGRFLRLNSWDAVTRPRVLLTEIGRIIGDPGISKEVWGVTLIYGSGLLLGYVALRMLSKSMGPETPA